MGVSDQTEGLFTTIHGPKSANAASREGGLLTLGLIPPGSKGSSPPVPLREEPKQH